MSSGPTTPWPLDVEEGLLKALIPALERSTVRYRTRTYVSAGINERLLDIEFDRRVGIDLKLIPRLSAAEFDEAGLVWSTRTLEAFQAGSMDLDQPVERFIRWVESLQQDADASRSPLNWLKLATNASGSLHSCGDLIGGHGALAPLVIALIGRPVEDTPSEIWPRSARMRSLLTVSSSDAAQRLWEEDDAEMESQLRTALSHGEMDPRTAILHPRVDMNYLFWKYRGSLGQCNGALHVNVHAGVDDSCYCQLARALWPFFGDVAPVSRAQEAEMPVSALLPS
ncbi:hypothetical protein CALVIDRAFT_366654 [Calocera viscosa TUFC12733]|uniref:Uncharacterized protein n=1 Tax=Calocera viscosa (strain TUFC12733) TaxID=1330018 RepID=A0A167H169_CALVF|nr:hypothetical protein CALVIDRAFT_366654 [Calocera viscosa TUFC12733]